VDEQNTPHSNGLKNESDAEQEELQVAKLVRPSDIGETVKEWKLASFEDERPANTLENVSSEVLQRMQDAMRPQLRQQTEVLKKEAYDKAFQQGYDEGLNKGLEEGRLQGEADAKAEVMQQLDPKLKQFEDVLGSLQRPYELLEETLYFELVDLALHIAETVVSKSVSENREWVLDAIQQSVAQLPESKSEINVYLNPDDLAFVQISKPTITEKGQLHENPNLSIGSCIVKQDHSSVINDWKMRFTDISNQVLDDAELSKNNQIQQSNQELEKPVSSADESANQV